jgi:hypothetical protein
MIALSRSMRCSRVVCEKVSNARRAAATAMSTSFALPSAMRAIGSSVAGLITVNGRAPAAGSTQRPSM